MTLQKKVLTVSKSSLYCYALSPRHIPVSQEETFLFFVTTLKLTSQQKLQDESWVQALLTKIKVLFSGVLAQVTVKQTRLELT